MLIGNGNFYRPRLGLLSGGVNSIGSCLVSIPIWNGVNHRQMFDKDYTALPSGAYQDAIVMALKYGGMGVSFVSSGSSTFGILGDGSVSLTESGSANLQAPLTGLKDSPCYSYGAGSMTAGVSGNGTIQCTVSIGAQPSAFDIAQAVWGMDNGIESGWTPRQIMRVMAAVLAGKTTIGTGTPVTVSFRSIDDSRDTLTAEMDGSERTHLSTNA